MKNTVLLIRNAARSDFGGAETYPVSLAKILQKQNVNPIIVSRSANLIRYARSNDIDVVWGWWWSKQNWSGKQVLLFPAYVIWQVILTGWYVKLILRTHPTVLHIQSKDDFIAGTFAGRLLGKRVIWTDHMDLRYIFQNISRPLRNPIGKLAFFAAHLATHIILISDNEHRLVTAHFPKKTDLKKRIVIIKNGVIDQKSNYSSTSRKKEFVYCLASRIVTNKGIGESIDAFNLLESQVQSAYSLRLNIYGDGLEMAYFKERAKMNPHITFYGHQQDSLDKINQADVFMLPSYQEGFSIALLEATMLGKAIIASEVDSNTEIITNKRTGLIVKARNPEELMQAMHVLLINPPFRHSLETHARENYVKNFNLDTIVQSKILPLYFK